MLALRAEIAGTPAPAGEGRQQDAPLERYVDLHYYDQAIRLIGSR